MSVDDIDKLLAECLRVWCKTLVITRGQLDREVVRHQAGVAGQHLCGVVELTLEGRGDLHRLDG